MSKQFAPKGEDILKQEETKYIDDNFSHLEEDDREKLIEDRVASRLKDESFKANEKNKTAKARKGIDFAVDRKDHYKTLAKGKAQKSENDTSKLSEDEIVDRAVLKMKGYNKNDFRLMKQARTIYKEEGKNISLDDARKTKLFLSMKEQSDKKSNDKDAQLGRAGLGTGNSNNKNPQPANQKEKDFVEAMNA